MSDALLQAIGVSAGFDLPEEVEALLDDEAERFLLAGGVVSLSEWALMSESSRQALGSAGSRLRVIDALRMSAALRGDVPAVLAEIDGGECAREAALSRAAASIAAKNEGRRHG